MNIPKEEEKFKNEEEELVKEIKNYKIYYIYIYGLLGLLFLLFNWILLTSFCGIYPNTVSKLFTNTFASMIGSFTISSIFYLTGSIIRYYSIKQEREIL